MALWCLRYNKTITPNAVKQAGGQLATYRQPEGDFTVLAFPIHRGDNKPINWLLVNLARTLPIRHKDGNGNWVTEWVSKKMLPGLPASGIIGRLTGAKHLNKMEGLTDLLAALSQDVPAGHDVVTNAAGCGQNANGNPSRGAVCCAGTIRR